MSGGLLIQDRLQTQSEAQSEAHGALGAIVTSCSVDVAACCTPASAQTRLTYFEKCVDSDASHVLP